MDKMLRPGVKMFDAVTNHGDSEIAGEAPEDSTDRGYTYREGTTRAVHEAAGASPRTTEICGAAN